MRLLFILPSINLQTGGTAKSNLRLAQDLASHGHEVELFTTCWPNLQMQTEHTIEQSKVLIRVFPASAIPGLRHVPYSPSLIKATSDALGRFDMFNAASLWNPLISHVMTKFRQGHVPYSITLHGMMDPIVFARHRAFKWCWSSLWERRNVEAAELVVFTSEREKQKAHKQGWRLRRTIVLPHTIILSEGHNLPARNQIEQEYPRLIGKEVVVFVGRINWVKNLDLLIAAVALLLKQGRNIALVCAGPDSDNHQKDLERSAAALGIGEAVCFTGLLQGEALRAVFARADVVALVSRKENFGLAAGEALAAGVPVVLSDGVDMGDGWPAPPVWRVEQNVTSIAAGLSAALTYSQAVGLPAADALNLAEREWKTSPCDRLIKSYETILTERR